MTVSAARVAAVLASDFSGRGGLLRCRLEALQLAQGDTALAERLLRRTMGGQPTGRLADGTVGYYMRPYRTDDCFCASVATVLQVPIGDLPDPNFDLRVILRGEDPAAIEADACRRLAAWLASRDLRLVSHSAPPIESERWIGIVPASGHFEGHSLVMSGTEVLFDPSRDPAFESLLDRRVRAYGLADVSSGFTFEPVSTKPRRR